MDLIKGQGHKVKGHEVIWGMITVSYGEREMRECAGGGGVGGVSHLREHALCRLQHPTYTIATCPMLIAISKGLQHSIC